MNKTEQQLMLLQEAAVNNQQIKSQLVATRSEPDPLYAFCQKSKELGYNIELGELVACGDNFCDAMLRSVNGGGVESPEQWNDAYEMFFSSI